MSKHLLPSLDTSFLAATQADPAYADITVATPASCALCPRAGDGAFTLFSGLAPSADPTALYALANPAGGGHCQVLHVNATRPDTVAVLATLPLGLVTTTE